MKNRVFFSIFYTAAVVFPHVVSLTYWLILVPHDHEDVGGSIEHLFGNGWFKPYCIINLFAVNSLIATIEVVFLSSIRRQTPIWAHLSGLTTLTLVYIGWAHIGKLLTGHYAYYFLDDKETDWEYKVAAITALSALPNIFFAFVYGLTGLRQVLTKALEDRTQGYSRIPQ